MKSLSLSDKIDLALSEGSLSNIAAKANSLLQKISGNGLSYWLRWILSSSADKVAQKYDAKGTEKGGPPLTQQLAKLREVIPAMEGKIGESLVASGVLAAEVIAILYAMYFTSPWGPAERHQEKTTARDDENEAPIGMGLKMGHLRKAAGGNLAQDWEPSMGSVL